MFIYKHLLIFPRGEVIPDNGRVIVLLKVCDSCIFTLYVIKDCFHENFYSL